MFGIPKDFKVARGSSWVSVSLLFVGGLSLLLSLGQLAAGITSGSLWGMLGGLLQCLPAATMLAVSSVIDMCHALHERLQRVEKELNEPR